MKKRKLLFRTTLAALGLEGTLHAQTWDFGAGTQAWTDGANWNPDGVPTTGQAFINRATLGETPIITTEVSRTAADTFIGDGTAGVLDINAGGSVNTSTKWIFVGTGTNGNGTLNVNAGGSLTSDNDLRLANTASSTGLLNINGGTVSVARVATTGVAGSISVSNGGKLTTTSASTANTSSPDIQRLSISSFGAGSLVSGARDILFAAGANIVSGGTLTSARDIVYGAGNSGISSGMVTATRDILFGAGDTGISGGVVNATRNIRFGAGANTISSGDIDAGAELFIGNANIGSLLMSGGTVDTGAWLVVGIGTGGNGSFTLSEGTVTAAKTNAISFTTIGANNDAIGEITQTGGTWNQGGLGIILGEGGTAEGTFNLDGGTLNTPRIYSNNGNANLNLNGGTLRATKDEASFISANVEVNVEAGDAIIDTNGFNVTTGADLAGVGSLDKQGFGSLNLAGSANSLDSAMVSAGTLYISGALTTVNGITVDSTATIAAGDADGGQIIGSLSLEAGATIDITLGELTVASGGTVSFGSFGFDDIDGFDVMTAENGTYTILAGDFTLNEANISNFGVDDALDMGEGRFAYFEGGSLSVVVIPEPSAALLGGLSALALLRRRRR